MQKFSIKKWFLIDEKIHYCKNLKDPVDSAQLDKALQDPELSFDYYSRVPPGLLPSLGLALNHAIDKHTTCLVLRCNNIPVGCKLFNTLGKARFIHPFKCEISFPRGHVYGFGLFIKSEFRGKGLGKLINLEANRRLADEFSHVDSLVDMPNYISHRNLQQLGFQTSNTFIFIKFSGLDFSFRLSNGRPVQTYRKMLSFVKTLMRPVVIGIPGTIKRPIGEIRNLKDELLLTSYRITDTKNPGEMRSLFICKGNPDAALLKRFYPNGYSVEKESSFLRWKLPEILNKADLNIDFAIADVRFRYISHDLHRLDNIHVIPKWVRQVNSKFTGFSDFTKSRNRDAYNDLQAAKKYSYDYEFTKDEILFRFFYEKMYCPYIQKRYIDEQVIMPYSKVKKEFEKGGLILLKDSATNRYLAGSIVRYENNTFYLVKLGLLNGDTSLLRRGVLAVLYISCFKFLLQIKGQAIDFGLSRSFLNDGVLKYKSKWNAAVNFDYKKGNVFLLKTYRPSSQTDTILEHNPFISLERNKLVGNIFLRSADKQKEIETGEKYALQGLAELRIFDIGNSGGIRLDQMKPVQVLSLTT